MEKSSLDFESRRKYLENVYIRQITITKPSASVKTTLRVFLNSFGNIWTVLERFEHFEFLCVCQGLAVPPFHKFRVLTCKTSIEL